MLNLNVIKCKDAWAMGKNAQKHYEDRRAWKFVGHGAFARVYRDTTRPKVAKIAADDKAYAAWIRAILPIMGRNPWVPRVSQAREYVDPGHGQCMVVEMEALTSPWRDWGIREKATLQGEAVIDSCERLMEGISAEICHRGAGGKRLPVGDAAFDEVMAIIRRLERAGYGADLHKGNFMLRGDVNTNQHQLVFTDPLAGSPE